jgi:acetoin utilization protein AcuC
VIELSKRGSGLLDAGDTPAFPGVYEAAANVVGGTLEALAAIVAGPVRRAFIPIGGLHHATRDSAAGFCVFNDCGVAIEAARKIYGIRRVAYVDIDAHHGDGVFYAFETDPDVKFADLHEDGRFLYPGTGSRSETGRGLGEGTKLNIPLPPGADDAVFLDAWQEVERYLEAAEPELILLQCGADSLAGDPITHLKLTAEAHAHAARRLGVLADRYAKGRVLAMGGGGYNRANLGQAWTRVVEELAA